MDDEIGSQAGRAIHAGDLNRSRPFFCVGGWPGCDGAHLALTCLRDKYPHMRIIDPKLEQ
ncbi:MAG: hypothetical protein JO370_09855 [Paucibacter sp.]|nr:hypothetical protein [Roseateles sp.]